MLSGNYRLALARLRTSKWNSSLTMFGIIIGIVSVVTIVSLGEGIKRQVLGQVNHIGSNLITIRPGKIVTRNADGLITKVNPVAAYGFGNGSLSDQDVATVQKIKGIKQTSPISLLNSGVSSGSAHYDDGFVLGTDAALPQLLGQKVEFGTFFSSADQDSEAVVIGKRVAEQLFKENVPIGQTLTIRGQDFIVRGIFEEFGSSTIGQGIDLNKAVFVSYPVLSQVAKGSAQTVQILVRPETTGDTSKLISTITNALTQAHGGQQDVTVLRQDENVTITSDILTLLTSFIGGIAAISLLVGGIGIMNIMLVSVSERTYEIGIRKAIGATNRQIRNQFMAEALTLSFVGGVLGVIISFGVSFLLRVATNFHPVITWPVVAVATGVSLAVGVIFGTVPAVKAARKDPIEALRTRQG